MEQQTLEQLRQEVADRIDACSVAPTTPEQVEAVNRLNSESPKDAAGRRQVEALIAGNRHNA